MNDNDKNKVFLSAQILHICGMQVICNQTKFVGSPPTSLPLRIHYDLSVTCSMPIGFPVFAHRQPVSTERAVDYVDR